MGRLASLKRLLHVPFGRHLRADRQVADDYVGAGILQDLDDVVRRAVGLLDLHAEVLADAVVGHAAMDGHVEIGHIGELDRVVGIGPHRLAQVFADLGGDDVERGRKLDVADVVAANGGVHEAGDFGVVGGVLIIMHALDERVGAVADADDGNADLLSILSHCVLLQINFRCRARAAASW